MSYHLRIDGDVETSGQYLKLWGGALGKHLAVDLEVASAFTSRAAARRARKLAAQDDLRLTIEWIEDCICDGSGVLLCTNCPPQGSCPSTECLCGGEGVVECPASPRRCGKESDVTEDRLTETDGAK